MSCVPPTDVTYGEADGYWTPPWYAPSPELNVTATPGWYQSPSHPVSPLNSPVPQLLVTTLAPSATASSSAVPRSPNPLELASTSRMWHRGQVEETISTSREISSAAPVSGVG